MATKKSTTDNNLIEQVRQIASGLGKTFAPFCEVVVHDLRDPERAIVHIENNLSGRSVGDPATELGLVRIGDAMHEQVVANYANSFEDGRRVKSTSIGIRGESGNYIAALCLNLDLTIFDGLANVLAQFGNIDTSAVAESLEPTNAELIRKYIDTFAAKYSTMPRTLSVARRRELVRQLKDEGYLNLRSSAEIIAGHLGVSRGTIYGDVKG